MVVMPPLPCSGIITGGIESMNEPMQVLEMIEAGEISAEEGARRLEAIVSETTTSGSANSPTVTVPRPAMVEWLWQVVFWTGVALVAVGGLLVASVYAENIVAGWLVWGWILFVLGVLVVSVGWWLQRAHWLSVRVRQPHAPSVLIALPLPLGPVAWVLRVARPFVPQLEETGVDEVILALRDEIRAGRPFRVEVDEGEGGEQVQVYFG
jgi:hypothetical protein